MKKSSGTGMWTDMHLGIDMLIDRCTDIRIKVPWPSLALADRGIGTLVHDSQRHCGWS